MIIDGLAAFFGFLLIALENINFDSSLLFWLGGILLDSRYENPIDEVNALISGGDLWTRHLFIFLAPLSFLYLIFVV